MIKCECRCCAADIDEIMTGNADVIVIGHMMIEGSVIGTATATVTATEIAIATRIAIANVVVTIMMRSVEPE